MTRRIRRTFTPDFKREAVRLTQTSVTAPFARLQRKTVHRGRPKPVAGAALLESRAEQIQWFV